MSNKYTVNTKNHYKTFRSLPFIASHRARTNIPCWNVPATGGYFGGYETGDAMALALLQALRSGAECPLPAILQSLMKRFEEEGGTHMANQSVPEWSDSYASFRGQYAGFFNTLAEWLRISVQSPMGSSLDQITKQGTNERINAGLGGTPSSVLDCIFKGKQSTK